MDAIAGTYGIRQSYSGLLACDKESVCDQTHNSTSGQSEGKLASKEAAVVESMSIQDRFEAFRNAIRSAPASSLLQNRKWSVQELIVSKNRDLLVNMPACLVRYASVST